MQSTRPAATGWRDAFGELWSQVALGDLLGRDLPPPRVARSARQHLGVVRRDLFTLPRGSRASRRSALRSAVVSLECSARVWQAFGPVAGERRLHLLYRLEQALSDAERQINAGELSMRVNRPAVSRAARGARGAIEALLAASADRAEALATLEDDAVELASLAVRIAMGSSVSGGGSRVGNKQPAALVGQLQALTCEVGAAARGRRATFLDDARRDHLGLWLGRALSIVPPVQAIALASVRDGDRSLRVDALFALRARWLELAVALWLTVQGLDDLLLIRTFEDDERLKAAVSSRASGALMAGALCQRPAAFDHEYAWARHREDLCKLLSDVCLALQGREADDALCAQQLALRRLARAVAALWSIDESVRRSAEQAGRRCR